MHFPSDRLPPLNLNGRTDNVNGLPKRAKGNWICHAFLRIPKRSDLDRLIKSASKAAQALYPEMMMVSAR